MTEKELQDEVRGHALRFGWRMYHTFDSRRSEAGFPDVVVVHPTRGDLVVAELKSEKGRLTVEQELWLAAFEGAGVETHVWRPQHRQEIAWRFGPKGYRTQDVGAVG